MKTVQEMNTRIVEFTVAPMVASNDEKSFHEWFIEFEEMPSDLNAFAEKVDQYMRSKNIYYDDLIRGNILRPLVIRPLKKNAFIDYMRAQGKLGGQNKVPRLSNDRKIASELEKMVNNS
jgi:hypothetical protein